VKEILSLTLEFQMSGHKLCFRRDIGKVKNLRKPIVNSQWDLVNFVDSNNLPCGFI